MATINPRPVRGEQRRLRTRTALIGAGQRLFSARAKEGVTIDEIVAEAAVAKGSFYNHFADKERLAEAVVALVQGDCEFHVHAANRGVSDPALRMVRALCVVIGYGIAHPDRIGAMTSLDQRTDAGAALNTGLVADLREGLARGRFAGIGLDAALLIVIGVVRTLAVHVIAGPVDERVALAADAGAGLLRALGMNNSEAALLARDAAVSLLGARP